MLTVVYTSKQEEYDKFTCLWGDFFGKKWNYFQQCSAENKIYN